MSKATETYQIYDQIALSYDQVFFEPSEHIDDFIRQLPHNGNILDIGCGTGVDAGYIAKQGHNVIGIDLSHGMLALAKQHHPEITFLKKDFTKISYPAKSFDGIVAACSLIHIPKKNVPQILKKCHTMLKDNGIIYIQVQCGKSEEIYVTEPFKPDEKLFINVISKQEMNTLLKDAGFTTIVKKEERGPRPKGELAFNKLYVIAKK